MRSDADYARLAARAESERKAERERLDREVSITFSRMRGAAPKAAPGPVVPSGKDYRLWRRGGDGAYCLDVGEDGYIQTSDGWYQCDDSTANWVKSALLGRSVDYVKLVDCGPAFDAIVASFEAWQAKQGG